MDKKKVPQYLAEIINRIHGIDKQKPLVEGKDYTIAPGGEDVELSQEFIDSMRKRSKELTKTKGMENMLGNPIMSSVFKKNPKRNQTNSKPEAAADTSISEDKEKLAPKKDPLINHVAPASEAKLKAGDSEGDILGKIFNLMVEKYHRDDANFKEETKYKEKLKEKKETRSKELIDLFTPGKKKPIKRKKEEKKEKEGTAEKVEPKTTGTTKGGTSSAVRDTTNSVVSTGTKAVVGVAAAGAAVVGVDALAAKITKNEGGGNPNQANIVKGHSAKEAQIVKGNVDVTTGKTFDKSLEEMTLGEAYDLGTRRGKYYNAKGAGAALGKYGFMPIAIEDRGKALYGKDWRNVPFDSKTQDELNKSLITTNLQKLQKAGIPPSERNLYLMHFFGNTAQTSALLNSSDESSMAPILDMYNHGATANPDVAKLTVGQYKKRFLAKFDDTPADLQAKSVAQPVSNPPTTIPSKIPDGQSSSVPSTTIISKTTNVIKGGTTYSITEDNSPDTPPLIDRQYNLR